MVIKGQMSVNPKLQKLRDMIKKNEDLFKEVEPPYKQARSKFEKFLNLRGAELLEEWGVWGTDFKLVKRPKSGKKDGKIEDTKVAELDMDHLDRSYLGTSMSKKKRSTVVK